MTTCDEIQTTGRLRRFSFDGADLALRAHAQPAPQFF